MITMDSINDIKYEVEGEVLTIQEFFAKDEWNGCVWNIEWLAVKTTNSPNPDLTKPITYYVTTSINRDFKRFNTTVTKFINDYVDPINTRDKRMENCKTYNLEDANIKHNELVEKYCEEIP